MESALKGDARDASKGRTNFQGWPNLHRLWPKLANIGQILAKLGTTRSNFGKPRPNLALLPRPNLVLLLGIPHLARRPLEHFPSSFAPRILTNSGQQRWTLGPNLAKSAKTWPRCWPREANFPEIAPDVADIDHIVVNQHTRSGPWAWARACMS